MKKWILFSFLTVSQAWAGHRVGNGGDHIRATFIKVGESVIEFLQETEPGARIARDANLNLSALEATLDIERISVVDSALKDNSGSVVEAIGEPGRIQLQKEAWFRHFEKNHDVTYLVFHEMLRSAAVNDDNYRISSSLNPFPMTLRVDTKVVPLLPLIAEDNLKGIFELQKVQIAGPGCPSQAGRTRVEFNEEKNILEVQMNSYRNDVSKNRPIDRKSCSITIPVALPEGKRLVISQIDLLGKINLLPGAQTQLQFEAFLAGNSNTLKTRQFQPRQVLRGRTLTRRTEVLKSRCGESDNVRLNTSLLSKASGLGNDSAEIDEVSLYLTLEDCKI